MPDLAANEDQRWDQVEVIENVMYPGTWVCEAILSRDGEIERAMFSGPNAQGRAYAYALICYGVTVPR